MRIKELAIVVLLAVTISACGKQQALAEGNQEDTVSVHETNDSSVSTDAVFSVDKKIYENEYAVVTFKNITSDGLYLDVQNKLENRAERVIFDAVALDGLCVAAFSYDDNSIEPGQTLSVFLQGKIENPEHKTLSITGELYDDTGNGFATIEVIDFELGGTENAEYQLEPLFSEYSSDHIDVDYLGIDKTGIRLAVNNKNTYKINIVCSTLAINDEDTGTYYYTVSVPGHSTGVYTIDVYNGNPDLIPENIASFSGECYTWGPDGIEEDRFQISSDAPPKDAPKIAIEQSEPEEETTAEIETEENYSDKSNILNAESLLGSSVDSSGKVTANDQLVETTELYGQSGRFVPSADESETTVILWKYIFDQYGTEEYDTIKKGLTNDFGNPDNEGEVDDKSVAYWDDSATNIRKVLEYTHDSKLILHIYYIERDDTGQNNKPASASSKPGNNKSDTTQTEKKYAHTCEVDGCKNEGTHSLTGFSGSAEWYCDEHYQEMMDILDMMEQDVEKSKSSGSTVSGNTSPTAYDATLEYGSGDVLICSSEDAMERYMTALMKDNQGTISEMIMNGEVGYTAKGTKCNIVKRGFTKAQVKILDGVYAGNTVWVVIEAVKEK